MSCHCVFFFQAEDGIRDLVRSRGLGDVYKRQPLADAIASIEPSGATPVGIAHPVVVTFGAPIRDLSLIHI